MKTAKEVLTAFQVGKPTQKQKEHAKTLSEIYTMLYDLPRVRSIEIKENDFYFGKEITFDRWDSEPRVRTEGIKMKGEKWTFKTDTGSYSVSLPVGNPLYYAFCNRFPSLVPQPDQVKTIEPDRILILEKDLTNEVKKAMKFIKFDSLRLAMNCVHVTIKNGYCEIMGTNGSKLYRSGYLYFGEDQKDITFLLPIGVLQAAKITDSLTVGLYYDRDTITKGTVNGVSFDHCNNEPPLQYENVIPTYYDFVQFDRKELIQVVKSVLPCANKITHQIRMQFNGSIFVSAEDLDFSSENNVNIQYSKKTVKDFEIGVNGKLLLDCLNSLDGQLARLYSNGDNSKCIVIDNKALLMPVMLNQYV